MFSRRWLLSLCVCGSIAVLRVSLRLLVVSFRGTCLLVDVPHWFFRKRILKCAGIFEFWGEGCAQPEVALSRLETTLCSFSSPAAAIIQRRLFRLQATGRTVITRLQVEIHGVHGIVGAGGGELNRKVAAGSSRKNNTTKKQATKHQNRRTVALLPPELLSPTIGVRNNSPVDEVEGTEDSSRSPPPFYFFSVHFFSDRFLGLGTNRRSERTHPRGQESFARVATNDLV